MDNLYNGNSRKQKGISWLLKPTLQSLMKERSRWNLQFQPRLNKQFNEREKDLSKGSPQVEASMSVKKAGCCVS